MRFYFEQKSRFVRGARADLCGDALHGVTFSKTYL